VLGDRIAVIDTENNSASKYADEFDFDVCNLTNYNPQAYIKAINAAAAAGYDVPLLTPCPTHGQGKTVS